MIGLQTSRSLHTSLSNCFVIQRNYERKTEDYQLYVHLCQKARIRKKKGNNEKATIYFRGNLVQIGSIPIHNNEDGLEAKIQLLPGTMPSNESDCIVWAISEEQAAYQSSPSQRIEGKIRIPQSKKKRNNVLIFEENERKELAHEIDYWLYEAIAPSAEQDTMFARILQRMGFTQGEIQDQQYRVTVDEALRHLIAMHRYEEIREIKKKDRKLLLPKGDF